MKENTAEMEYLKTVQMLDIYKNLQEISNHLSGFKLSEALKDKKYMRIWLLQLDEVKRNMDYIDNMKHILLEQSIETMNGFIADE